MASSNSEVKVTSAVPSPSGGEPPPYKDGYAVNGTGAVASGSSRLSVPQETGAHVFTPLEDASAALNAGARLNVNQSHIYAEEEASEAIGIGLEPVEQQNKVSIARAKGDVDTRF